MGSIRRTCLGALVSALLLGGCTSTTLRDTWSAPDVGRLDFEKVLVVAAVKDEATRRSTEDRLVGLIKARGTEAVPSYTLLGEEQLDQDRVKAKLRESACDGAVVMRLVNKEHEPTWMPGTPVGPVTGFWGHYGTVWGGYYDPGYLTIDTVVSVETNVYSLADEKLVWSGVTETTNPEGAVGMVDEIAAAVVKDMEKKGLVRGAP
jgi:hypothetical protein